MRRGRGNLGKPCRSVVVGGWWLVVGGWWAAAAAAAAAAASAVPAAAAAAAGGCTGTLFLRRRRGPISGRGLHWRATPQPTTGRGAPYGAQVTRHDSLRALGSDSKSLLIPSNIPPSYSIFSPEIQCRPPYLVGANPASALRRRRTMHRPEHRSLPPSAHPGEAVDGCREAARYPRTGTLGANIRGARPSCAADFSGPLF